MADPFNLFGGNDAKTSSTIDDDFDALFGPIGGDAGTEVTDEREEDTLDDFLKPTQPEPAAKKARTDPTTSAPEGNVSLIDLGDTPDSTGKTSSTTTDTDGSTTKSLNLNKDKLFSFDNDDPGLDDVLLPSTDKSSSVENQSALNDTQQQQSSVSSKTNTASSDLLDDIFAPKSNNKPSSEITSSLDDIFAPSSSTKPQTEESLTDLFVPQNKSTNKQKSDDALDDIFGQSFPSSGAQIPDVDLDIFASTNTKPLANKDEPSKPNSSSKGENWLENDLTKQEKTTAKGNDSIFEYASQPEEDSTSKETVVDDTRRNEKPDLSADLLADLPTPITDTCPAVSSHSDTSANKEDLNVVVAPAVVASGDVIDAKGGPAEMDQQPEEVAGGAQSHTVPDILDFLGDASQDLPDISTLESENANTVDQLGVISHQSLADDDDIASNKRDHSTDAELLKDEVGDVEPTKPKKKKEEDDDSKSDAEGDAASATSSAGNVKLSVTAPSFDLGDGGEPVLKTGPGEEKDESIAVAKSEDSEKSKKLKDEINKDSEFMDFSVLSIPEESQLNVDISKHKRSLSKKGSLALRKRPSRRAIRSSGSDGDDTLFQDSTEPKPKVPSDDEDDMKEDEKRQDVFEAGRGDTALPMGGSVGRGPFKPPMTGGVKIPGLLEGLKKSKSFKSPAELKKTDTKKAPEKEEINFRSLLKSTPSSSTSPSKSLKESQNQNIAQTPPASVKPSDLRRQPMAGSIKLPAMIKPSSPSDKLSKQPPALSSRAPPPVASKPKPSLPSAKPRLSPIVKSEQTSKPSSAASPSSSSSSSSSPSSSSFFEKRKTNEEGPNNVSAISSPSSENVTNATATSSSLNDTSSSSTVKNSATSATSTIATTSTTTASSTSSPSSILSSIRPKPYAPPKPKPQPRPSPATKPSTPLSSDAKLSSNTTKVDTTQTAEDDADKISSTKITDKVDILEITSKTRSSSSSSSIENGQDMIDAGVLKPRKSSISGVSSVQSPIGPDRSAPRKSSISGSAYAPMGFKRSISNEGSEKSDDKPEPTSQDEGSVTSHSKSRTSSIAESSEKEKDEEDKEKIESKTEKGEKTNGTIDKDNQVEDKDSLKPKRLLQKDNRLSERNAENSSSDSNKPDTPQKPMWGVQLRKVDKKPPTPSKPSVDQSKEVESPANWRQQLANKRKSITPKDSPPAKGPEPSVPEWAKASSERRKRLMESGVIKSEAK